MVAAAAMVAVAVAAAAAAGVVVVVVVTASLMDLENTCYSGSNFSASETSLLPVQSLPKIPNTTMYVPSE